MEYEEIKRLIEIGEPVDGDLSLNNYSVGTISFFPHKLYEALEKLPDDGEVKILADEDEIELYLEKFRIAPPDEFEFERSKAALIKNDGSVSNFMMVEN